jgi:hypothetical protein
MVVVKMTRLGVAHGAKSQIDGNEGVMSDGVDTYCGVKYGEHDLDKVVESARKVTEKLGDETYLGFHEEAIYSLEEMLLTRYHMHRQVYGHRTRVATPSRRHLPAS